MEIAVVSDVYKDAIDVVKKQFTDREEEVLDQLTLRNLKKKSKEPSKILELIPDD